MVMVERVHGGDSEDEGKACGCAAEEEEGF